MFSVTAQMCTWASVSPGISVMPLQSSVVTRPGCAPTLPLRSTSLIRSSSTTTAAPSTGSAPVQSISRALVKTVILIVATFRSRVEPRVASVRHAWLRLSRDDLRLVHPDLLVGAGRPLDVLRHAVEVVLLPQEHPGRLVMDRLLEIRVGSRPSLGVDQRDRPGDLVVDHLVVAVGRVRGLGLEQRLDGALAVQGRAPAQEEHVAGIPVLDLVEVSSPLVDHHI